MPNVINGTSTGSGGLITSGDDSGILNIQTNETTAMSIDASQSVDFTNNIDAPNTFGFKSRIINSGMVIDQRNAGASVTPTTTTVGYPVDRFYSAVSQNSKLTIQQNAGSVTPPSGFIKYIGITSSSAYTVTTNDFFNLQQNIEGFNVADLGWGTANAQTVTLSFWVRSSLTGTFGGALENNAGNRCYPFSYSIPTANTWTAISITIAGDTTGTWLTDNSVGISIRWSMVAGTTFGSGTAGAWSATRSFAPTGATSVVGTNGATFYITGVQLEKGTQATSFDFRSYGTELALCQRYYIKFFDNNSSNVCNLAVGLITSGTTLRAYAGLPVTMRSAPTVTQSGCRVYDGTGAPTVTSIGQNQCTTTTLGADFNATGGGLTVGRGGMVINTSGSEYVDASAEL